MNEQQQAELYKQSETGHDAKACLKFLEDFLLKIRTQNIYQLETEPLNTLGAVRDYHILMLRVLRSFENYMKTYIQKGEIAEDVLNGSSEER